MPLQMLRKTPRSWFPRPLMGKKIGFPLLIDAALDQSRSKGVHQYMQDSGYLDDQADQLSLRMLVHNSKLSAVGIGEFQYDWDPAGFISVTSSFQSLKMASGVDGFSMTLWVIIGVYAAYVFFNFTTLRSSIRYQNYYAMNQVQIEPHRFPVAASVLGCLEAVCGCHDDTRLLCMQGYAGAVMDLLVLGLVIAVVISNLLQVIKLSAMDLRLIYNVYDNQLSNAGRLFLPAKDRSSVGNMSVNEAIGMLRAPWEADGTTLWNTSLSRTQILNETLDVKDGIPDKQWVQLGKDKLTVKPSYHAHCMTEFSFHTSACSKDSLISTEFASDGYVVLTGYSSDYVIIPGAGSVGIVQRPNHEGYSRR